MSKHINVNPGQYKVAGRERPGDDIPEPERAVGVPRHGGAAAQQGKQTMAKRQSNRQGRGGAGASGTGSKKGARGSASRRRSGSRSGAGRGSKGKMR